MAKTFSKLKSPLLGLTDLLTFGKLNGCRVCDVIEDQYEYLIWAEKQGLVKFQQNVIAKIKKQAGFEDEKRHYEEEVQPWLDELEDIPF